MRTTTLAGVRLLPPDALEQAHASVIVALRRERDPAERQRLGKFLLAIDSERGRRRKGRSEARGGRSDDQDGESLAERLVEAREALYQESSKAEIRQRAERVRADMQDWKNRPNAA